MTDATTASWLRDRLWIAWATAVAVWSVWIGSLALGTPAWKRDAEGMLLCAGGEDGSALQLLTVDGETADGADIS